MPQCVLLEEFHLTLTVPQRTADDLREILRKTLTSPPFRRALRKAVSGCLRSFQMLPRVRLTIDH